MKNAIKLALGLTRGGGVGGWWDTAALLDIDFEHDRARYNNTSYTVAGLLAAIDGTQAGSTYTIAPKVVGAELLVNGTFDTDVSGWAFISGTSIGTVTWNAGRMQIASAGGGDSITRVSRSVTLVESKAYRYGGKQCSPINTTYADIGLAVGNYFTVQSSTRADISPDQVVYGYGAIGGATGYIGAVTQQIGAHTELWDDFTVKEVVPVVGHNYLALSGVIYGTTPTAASGNKVPFQADDNGVVNSPGVTTPSERNRVRPVWDSSQHLRLIVTQANTEQVNLDLGVVPPSTAFTLEFSAAKNNFMARLNSQAPLFDTSGNHPGIACFRYGRSNTGETWDGVTRRVTLYPEDRAERYKLAMWGDSLTQALAGSIAGYTGGRPAYNGGVGGESIDSIAIRMLADTTYRDRIITLWDRMNSGDNNLNYVTKMASMVARCRERHERFIIISDINKTDGTEDAGSAWRIAQDARNAILAAAYSGHFLDLVSALDNNALRTDGLHLTGPGYQIVGDAVLALALANGW